MDKEKEAENQPEEIDEKSLALIKKWEEKQRDREEYWLHEIAFYNQKYGYDR